ncbi:adenylate/guanylate cyclase domain-containing protein [Nocardioides sp. zg-ZUI104]|uniref:adenylate/guanylate cyclase domain-containing protein n=1 Tax=Nocardioides faecalis TaxID=2803858 RepID=UPI001BCD7828|nr:adenylate/guanylate cyclase domain-containing protein [Nocardioides faecalis]MBS4753665.1 adenylate/guanylate cyclase domain-containing protein [Nocardioides faecalis]
MDVLALVAGLACLLLAAAIVVLLGERRRLRRRLAQSQEVVAQLQADLGAALRPPPASTPTERAVRRVIRTASRVREQGITGLVQDTLEGLQVWAGQERADILNMAAPDGTVTLFFSDIEDSTTLNHRLGDAAWMRVLTAHSRVLRGRIEKYRGRVVKTAGDGFMVAFRDPEAACRAATGIQRDLRRDLTLRRYGGVRVRIGVHTGQVVARDGDYFGRDVAMAARVADRACGGEVLLSDAVREALGEDTVLRLEELAPVELKGLPGAHVLWRVLPRVG